MSGNMNEIERLQKLAGISRISEEDEVTVNSIDNEPNDEIDSIKKDLYQMGKYCVELHRMLSNMDSTDFPHWWQAKLIKAKDYISAAKHYLENENANTDQRDIDYVEPSVSADAEDYSDPSGVS